MAVLVNKSCIAGAQPAVFIERRMGGVLVFIISLKHHVATHQHFATIGDFDFDSGNRRHTSFASVFISPEIDDDIEIDINPADVRVDTYRASGAGGQHVNRTDSAVRLTHLPTNTVVECQDERSQHKNRARAMSLLKARLLAAERERQTAERAATRKLLVGSGDRSQRIRTYNFPRGRITDHRIGLTLYKLDEVMAGGLDAVIEPLIAEHQAELLAAMGEA